MTNEKIETHETKSELEEIAGKSPSNFTMKDYTSYAKELTKKITGASLAYGILGSPLYAAIGAVAYGFYNVCNSPNPIELHDHPILTLVTVVSGLIGLGGVVAASEITSSANILSTIKDLCNKKPYQVHHSDMEKALKKALKEAKKTQNHYVSSGNHPTFHI